MSSAGEQLIRDTTDVRQKCQYQWAVFLQSIDIFRVPYAFKNPSINLFLRSNESPL